MKKNRVTQQSAILKHLQEKGSITSKEAFNLFGATRLSAQIFELRRKGYNIETITRYGKTRFGTACEYAEYKLIEEEM